MYGASVKEGMVPVFTKLQGYVQHAVSFVQFQSRWQWADFALSFLGLSLWRRCFVWWSIFSRGTRCIWWCAINGWNSVPVFNGRVAFFVGCLTAGSASVWGEVIVVCGSPSNIVFFEALESLGGCQKPLGSISSFLLLVGCLVFSVCLTYERDLYITCCPFFVILLWVTWRDHLKDWFSSLFDEFENSSCSVTSFSGAFCVMTWSLCGIFCFRRYSACQTGHCETQMHLPLCVCSLTRSGHCEHMSWTTFLVYISVSLALAALSGCRAIVDWHRHVSCCGTDALCVPFFPQ